MKSKICTLIGLIGGAVVTALGGWDASIMLLMICICTDYATGLVVAGVFHRSNKSQGGTLESRAGFKGLCRKAMILLFVLIAHYLDTALGTEYIRDAVVIGFSANELLSIIENAGLMGVPIPAVIRKAVDVLNEKAGDGHEENR